LKRHTIFIQRKAKKITPIWIFFTNYGTLFLELGELTKGYQLAREFQNLIDRQHMGTAPLNVLRFVYPLPYRKKYRLFRLHLQFREIDPFFVYSVMRRNPV
jgi:soluble lytic murein transglycosylase